MPEAGFEPAQPIQPRDFKSLASTNSATRAHLFLLLFPGLFGLEIALPILELFVALLQKLRNFIFKRTRSVRSFFLSGFILLLLPARFTDLFNRKIVFALLGSPQNFYLYNIPYFEMLADIPNISVRNLGNMYKAGLPFGQLNKCPKVRDPGHLPFNF